MIDQQSMKVEVLVAPATQSVATNSSNYGYLDTLGWEYARIVCIGGALATTSAAFATLNVTEGTNSAASTAIVALTGGTETSTSVGFVIPAYKGTGEGTAVVLDIDLRKRERYLRVNIAPGAASVVSAIAILSRGKVMPGSDVGSVQKQVIA